MIYILFQDTIPLFGLSQVITIILVFIIGILGSIIAVILFPRVFTLLFLKIKAILKPRYRNTFIENSPKIHSKRKFIIRTLYNFLLELGLMAFIIPILDPDIFLTEEYNSAYYESVGIVPEYTMNVLYMSAGLLLPLIMGLWSVGWILEDSGLMHYKLDRRPGKELYEIEPVHIYVNNFIKGYAGISSIFFLTRVAVANADVAVPVNEIITNVFFTLLIAIVPLLFSIPAYVIYSKCIMNKKFLRANLKELKMLSEEEIIK